MPSSKGWRKLETATAAFGSSLPVTCSLTIAHAGGLGPASSAAGDPSAIDEDKLLDILLAVEYRVSQTLAGPRCFGLTTAMANTTMSMRNGLSTRDRTLTG